MLSKELVAASTIPVVLSILSEDRSYGYEIIRKVHELSGGKIQWSEGMLYPVLHWMEKEGMIVSEWDTAETGRKRKYYRIAKNGQRALLAQKEEWDVLESLLGKLWNIKANSI